MDGPLLHTVIPLCFRYDTSDGVLNELRFQEVGFPHVNEKRVAIIESRAKYTASDHLRNVVRQGRSDVPQCPDVEVACLAHSCYVVIECAVSVDDDTDTFDH